jgi:plasmid replication initiation protein
MGLVMNKKRLVVQSNHLVEAKYRLSVDEQKIIRILISQIQKDDIDFKKYEFRVNDLADLLGMKHNNPYNVLEKITEKLLSRVLKFYNHKEKTLLQASWLSSALYKKGEGIVTLCFDPHLKPLLLQLQSYFTKYELEQIMQFNGQYTIRFFELMNSFLGRNKHEVTFSLKELREILGLKKDEYTVFQNFKIRVINSAQLELLEKTGKSFTWEPIKQGRGGKIVAVKLVFDDDGDEDGNPIISKIIPEIAPGVTIAEPAEELVQRHPLPDELQAVLNDLLQLGLAEKTAREVVENHSIDQILEKLALTRQQKNIQNQAGFFVEALRKNWHHSTVEKARQQQQKQQQERQERQKRDQWELRIKELQQLKKQFTAYRKEVALEQYEKAGATVVQQWKEAFFEEQPIWKSMLRGKTISFGNPMFQAFVMKQLELPTLDEFLAKNNIQLSAAEMQWLRAA